MASSRRRGASSGVGPPRLRRPVSAASVIGEFCAVRAALCNTKPGCLRNESRVGCAACTTPNPADPRHPRAIVDPRIAVRPSTLADGRELIYFDDADTTLPAERAVDERALDPAPRDRAHAPGPAHRRVDLDRGGPAEPRLPPAGRPRPARTADGPATRRRSRATYDVAVFENRSPSFGPELAAPDASSADALADLRRVGLERTSTSVGRCEVVCFSPEHEGSFGTLSVSRARTVIEAWAQRTAALSALPGRRGGVPLREPRT